MHAIERRRSEGRGNSGKDGEGRLGLELLKANISKNRMGRWVGSRNDIKCFVDFHNQSHSALVGEGYTVDS